MGLLYLYLLPYSATTKQLPHYIPCNGDKYNNNNNNNKYYYYYYLFTPCSRVLPEKLTGFQVVKKFPAFYGTRRFITAVTRARHMSLF